MRILIVASNASRRFGGEAFIPLNYFRLLRRRNMDVRLVVHARNRAELTALFPDDLDRCRRGEPGNASMGDRKAHLCQAAESIDHRLRTTDLKQRAGLYFDFAYFILNR